MLHKITCHWFDMFVYAWIQRIDSDGDSCPWFGLACEAVLQFWYGLWFFKIPKLPWMGTTAERIFESLEERRA